MKKHGKVRLFLLEFIIEEVKFFSDYTKFSNQLQKHQLVVNFNFLKNVVLPSKSSKIHRFKKLNQKRNLVNVRGIQSCLFSLTGLSDEIDLSITASLYQSSNSTPFGRTVISIESIYELVEELLNCGEKNAYSIFSYDNFIIKSTESERLIGFLRGCVRLSGFA